MSVNSDRKPWPTQLAHEDVDWPAGNERILVPFHEAVNESETATLAASLTFGADGELYLLHTADSPVGDSDATRTDAEIKFDLQDRFDVPIRITSKQHSSDVLTSFVSSHDITTTVLDGAEESLRSNRRDEWGVGGDCHTVLGTGMDAFQSPSSILVPVARGPHSGLAAKIAAAIASAYGSWLELFHVVPDGASDQRRADASRMLEAYEQHLDTDAEVDHHVVAAADPAQGIVEHATYHDLTILGAPQKGKLRRFLFGSTTETVTEAVSGEPVLAVHNASASSRLRGLL